MDIEIQKEILGKVASRCDVTDQLTKYCEDFRAEVWIRGNYTVAKIVSTCDDANIVGIGIAKRHPKDVPIQEIGESIAFSRACRDYFSNVLASYCRKLSVLS